MDRNLMSIQGTFPTFQVLLLRWMDQDLMSEKDTLKNRNILQVFLFQYKDLMFLKAVQRDGWAACREEGCSSVERFVVGSSLEDKGCLYQVCSVNG